MNTSKLPMWAQALIYRIAATLYNIAISVKTFVLNHTLLTGLIWIVGMIIAAVGMESCVAHGTGVITNVAAYHNWEQAMYVSHILGAILSGVAVRKLLRSSSFDEMSKGDMAVAYFFGLFGVFMAVSIGSIGLNNWGSGWYWQQMALISGVAIVAGVWAYLPLLLLGMRFTGNAAGTGLAFAINKSIAGYEYARRRINRL